jgi:fatty-acyl-CoA synthase
MSEPIYTLGAMLASSARRYPDADALIFPDASLSHGELYESALKWAKALIALGVQPGEHVGLLLPTCPTFVQAMFGTLLAGAVCVPINARYQAGELAYLAENADLVAIVTTDRVAEQVDFVERLNDALPALKTAQAGVELALPEAPKLRRILLAGAREANGFTAAALALQQGEGVDTSEVEARTAAVSPQDTALILYTSGTTSSPKGCLISHRGIVGNSRNLGRRYLLTQEDRFWSPLPIFHIAGILPMVAALDLGGGYATVPYFEAGMALEMLERSRASCCYPSFVTFMQDLITHPRFPQTDLSRVRMMNSNFAVQPAWIKEAMAKAMPHAIQVGTYGLTEAAGTICTSRLDDPYELRTGRLGVPLDEWEVKIVDPETGEEKPLGEQGEIIARGPNMLKGYYRDPEKTAATIDKDGWMHTGDIGAFDESGHIMFHGRTKDMLKVGGENVAAAEIEAVLNSHPAVQLSQVVGVPDPRYVEAPAAFIELKAGQSATPEELIAFCKGKIANFKIPRHIRFVTSWPMSTSKIQKFRLRDELVQQLQEQAA